MTKIERWKDVAELVALVAVVASLFAVVVELRQTQVALQAQTYQARAFDAIGFWIEMAQDLELERLPPDVDIGSLTEDEFKRAQRLYTAIRIDLDNEYYQYRNGFLDSGFYLNSTVSEIKAAAPVWRKLGVVEPVVEFSAEVDRLLADPSIPTFNITPDRVELPN